MLSHLPFASIRSIREIRVELAVKQEPISHKLSTLSIA